MFTRKLMAMTTLAVLGLAGTASADFFYSNGTGGGAWGSYATTWMQTPDGDDPFAATRAPTAGDIVQVLGGDTVTVAANAAAAELTVDATAQLNVSASKVLTLANGTSHVYGQLTVNNSGGELDLNNASMIVENGGTLNVVSGAEMAIFGTTPSVIVIGTLTLDGRLQIGSSSGTPYLEVQTSQNIPNSTSGIIQGLASAAAQPEIRITTTGGARTLTNYGLMQGRLTVKRGSGANNANFVNHYHVDANVAASVIFDSSLASVSDDTSNAQWNVSTSGSAALQFNRGSATFSGSFNVLVSGGSLVINDTISATSPTNPLVYNLGSITVASGKNFYFSAGGGSCGSQPTSPLSNTFYNTCP